MFKGITPFKLSISNLINNEENKENNIQKNLVKNDESISQNNIQIIKDQAQINNYPPKKIKVGNSHNINISFVKNYSLEIIKVNKEGVEKSTNKIVKKKKKKVKKHKNKSDLTNEIIKKKEIDKNQVNKEEEKSLNNELIDNNKSLDNYELNNLDYQEAYDLDKRSFLIHIGQC